VLVRTGAGAGARVVVVVVVIAWVLLLLESSLLWQRGYDQYRAWWWLRAGRLSLLVGADRERYTRACTRRRRYIQIVHKYEIYNSHRY